MGENPEEYVMLVWYFKLSLLFAQRQTELQRRGHEKVNIESG